MAAEAFQGACSKCHGENGKGGYGPPLQNRTFDAGDIDDLLRNGRGKMPAVGSTWTHAEIAAMIRYLQKTKGGAHAWPLGSRHRRPRSTGAGDASPPG